MYSYTFFIVLNRGNLFPQSVPGAAFNTQTYTYTHCTHKLGFLWIQCSYGCNYYDLRKKGWNMS